MSPQSRTRLPASVNPDARTAELIAATGTPVPRGDYLEVLTITPEAIDLGRIDTGGVPFLDTHNPGSVGDQLGTVTSSRIEAGQLILAVQFARGPKADAALQNVADGITKGVSVGYEVLEHKDETGPNGEDVRRVTKWRLIEVSLVSVPADGEARVRSRATAEAAIFAEACRRFHIADAERDAIMRRGGNIQNWRESLMDHLAAREDATSGHNNAPAYVTRQQPRTDHFAVMGEALFLRSHPNLTPSHAARPYMGQGLESMLRAYYAGLGDPIARGSRHELFTRGMSTSDLPSILLNTANKELAMQFEAQQSPLIQIGTPTTFQDFRPKSFAKIGEFAPLLEVREGGEITYGAFNDDREDITAVRFARIIRVTREVIVNDDLQALADSVAMAARAIAEVRANLMVSRLLANSGVGQTMRDTNPAFHASRANVAGTGAAINDTSLTEAATGLRRQRSLAGNPIANEPKFLLVPPEQETVARRAVAQTTPATTAGANPFTILNVLVDPRLTSTTRWWLFADPVRTPFLRYGALEGQLLPQFEAKNGWDVDAVEMRVVDYFGAGVVEARAGWTNAGA